MSKTLKVISVILSVLTILGVFSVANPVLAAEVNEDYAITETIKEIQAEKEEPTIIGEIESKRDKYTKVFQKSDGTSVAVIASTPVHYEENGEWVDIDNTLVEATENNETVYENKSNDFTVTLPEEMEEIDAVSIEKDGYSLSFTLDGYDVFEKSKKSKANKKEKTKKEKSKTEIDESFIDKNETIVYENVGETTDIEYSVTSTGLKENIILTKKPKKEVSYTYTIVAENLNGKANEDGSVSFTDSQGNEIFNIPAPVMFDAKNVTSTDIKVAFSGENGSYKLTYTPSYDWLKKEAKYPVIIDPVINTDGNDNILDAYIDSEYPNDNTGDISLVCTQKTSSNEVISLFDINNTIVHKTDAVIKNITLYVNAMHSSTANNRLIEVGAYPITSSWSESNVTYNTKPTFGNLADKKSFNSSSTSYYVGFDVTECYTSLGFNEIFGIALKQITTGNSDELVMYASSEYTDSNYKPYFTIEYYETDGIKNQFDYHMQDVGRAGSVYYNDFSGQVHIEREDMGLYCLNMPVQIRSFYNSGLGGSASATKAVSNLMSPYGVGWSTNYNQTIEIVGEIEDGRFLYRDEDGEIIYFKNEENSDNSDVIKFIEDTDMFSNSKGYTLYWDISSGDLGLGDITIVDSNNQTMYFNDDGYLTKISTFIENSEVSSDKTEFSVTVSYRTDYDYLIDKITDGIGREYRFTYYETYDYPLVSSIQVFNKNGTAIKVGGADYKYVYSYEYTDFYGGTLPNLSALTYPDGEIVSYNLTGTNQTLKNIDGYTIEINKTNSNSHTITEKVVHETTTTGNILTVNKVNSYERIFIDKNNEQIKKQFDAYGRVISEIEGTTVVPRVYSENNRALGEISSRLYNTELTASVYENSNLIQNGSFIYGTTNWNIVSGVSHTNDTDAITNSTNPSSLKINGIHNNCLYANQKISVSDGVAGDRYYLQFSTKQSDSISSINNLYWCLVLIEAKTSSDETWDTIDYVEINPMNNNWQTYGMNFTLNENYNEINISLCYYLQNGIAYFDDIQLINTHKSTATTGSSSGSTGTSNTDDERCTCDGCTDLNCTCRDCSDNCTKTSCNRGFYYSYSSTGASVSISNGEKTMSFSNTNSSGFPNNQTDINGSTTRYVYNRNTGLLTREIDENSGNALYTYNAVGELSGVSQIVEGLSNGSTMQTNYTYENDRVKSITHNGFSYNYEYDVWGNVTSVKVGNQPLVSYNYDSNENRNRINKITYGNGDYTEYTFNGDGNISTIKSCESVGTVKSNYQYTYSTDGSLSAVLDVTNNIQTLYNGQNVTVKHLNGSGESDDVVYNSYTITENGDIVENYGGMSYTTGDISSIYKEETGGSVNKSTTSSTLKEYNFTSETDYFGRVVNKKTQTFYAEEEGLNIDLYLNSEYKYKDLENAQTTTLIDSYKSTVGLCAEVDGELLTDVYDEIEYFYDYDSVGNITRIYFKEFDDDETLLEEITVCSYVYDKASQLVRENNATLEKTYVFVYDVGGNIVSKTEYVFTEEEDLSDLTSTNTVNYSYDSVWKDKLVNFNGTEIAYDEIGNPLNYVKQDVIDGSGDTGTLTWNGRQLESVTIDGSTIKYSYDSDGFRTKAETFDSETGEFDGAMYYLWRDGKLAGYSNVDSDGETLQTIKMLFDNTGESIGYTYYDTNENEQTTFYFGKNAFGDIVTVYDDEGDALLTYTYDAWGAVSAKAHGTTAAAIIGAIVAVLFTPITYRGYNYDMATGLYYLQSRYYNPAYGRFLNADTTDVLETTKGTIHGANLFAYCNNNPVMNVDYTGETKIAYVIFFLVTVFMIFVLPSFTMKFLKSRIEKIYEENMQIQLIGGLWSTLEIVNDLKEINDMYTYYCSIFAAHAKNVIDYGSGKNTMVSFPGYTNAEYTQICKIAYQNAIDFEVISSTDTWDELTEEDQYIFTHKMLLYDRVMFYDLYILTLTELITWGKKELADFFTDVVVILF